MRKHFKKDVYSVCTRYVYKHVILTLDEKNMLKTCSKKDMQRARRTCMWVSQVPALYEMEDNNSTDVDSISSDTTIEQSEILRDDAGVIVREVRPRRVVGG